MPPPPALLSKDLEIKRAIWEGAGRACAVPPPPAGPAQWARPGPTRAPGGPRSAPARPGPGPYVRPPVSYRLHSHTGFSYVYVFSTLCRIATLLAARNHASFLLLLSAEKEVKVGGIARGARLVPVCGGTYTAGTCVESASPRVAFLTQRNSFLCRQPPPRTRNLLDPSDS